MTKKRRDGKSRYVLVRPLVVACRSCGAEGELPRHGDQEPDVIHKKGCLSLEGGKHGGH